MVQFRYGNRQIATLTHSLSLKGGKWNIHSAFHKLPTLRHCINLSVKKIFMVLDLSCSPLLLLSGEEQALLDASRAVLRPFSPSRVAKCLISCLTALEMQICDTIILIAERTPRAGLSRGRQLSLVTLITSDGAGASLALGEMTVLAIIRAWVFALPQDCYRSTSCYHKVGLLHFTFAWRKRMPVDENPHLLALYNFVSFLTPYYKC